MWMPFLSVYIGGLVPSLLVPKIYVSAIYNKMKKKGYDVTDRSKALKEIENTLGIGTIFSDFIPGLNVALGAIYICICFNKFKEEFFKVECALLDKKIIKKSDEVLKEEAAALIKQDKFEKVKESLGEGKLGSYTSMDRIEKLDFINEMESGLEQEHSQNRIFDALTLDEKKEFLVELRREVLGDRIEEKKQKRKLKKR